MAWTVSFAGAALAFLAANFLPVAKGMSVGILLTAFSATQHHGALRAALPGISGVGDIAIVGRARVGVISTRSVDGTTVDLAPKGYRYSLDAMAFDPVSYARLVGGEYMGLLTSMETGDAIISETSATIRRLSVGGEMELLGGKVLVVKAVVPDEIIQNREIAVVDGALDSGNSDVLRYFLFRYTGKEDTIEAALRGSLPEGARFGLRSLTPSAYIRSFASILSQAEIKLHLGEFAYRPTEGRYFQRDPEWESTNLINAEIPLLGEVRCHKVLVPALIGAMNEVISQGLASLIDPGAFQGCDNPRLIAEGRGFSRHAWGAAVDINYGDDPELQANARDPRLVNIMALWGFTSGHLFNTADPGHFEFVGPPRLEVETHKPPRQIR